MMARTAAVVVAIGGIHARGLGLGRRWWSVSGLMAGLASLAGGAAGWEFGVGARDLAMWLGAVRGDSIPLGLLPLATAAAAALGTSAVLLAACWLPGMARRITRRVR